MIQFSRRLIGACLTLGAAALAACDSGTGSSDDLFAPTGLSVTASSPTAVTVTFNTVPGATSYEVQRAAGTGTDFTTIGTVQGSPFSDTGLTPSATYSYRVAAVKGSQKSDYTAAQQVTLLNRPVVTISTDITSNRRLDSDSVYVLGAFVHVANGATLTIEEGTRIEGLPNSALFILRGAKILAIGTADKPIVFTSNRPAGQRQPGDWGGLIIVGNGIINRADPILLEGSNTGGTNYAVTYSGGTNNADDSGELRYVRVEFAGFGPAPDQELNSFTFAAVGSGTRLSYLQSMAGLDDSYEWFGGAVDAKYLVSYESGDDHFDASEGFQGRNQFLIAYQDTIIPPRNGAGNTSSDPQGIENDGCNGANCVNGFNSQPYTVPIFANFTLVGLRNTPVSVPAAGGRGMVLRRGTGGYYVNGIIARWPVAISIRDAATNDHLTAGDLQLKNILAVENATLFEAGAERYAVDQAANGIESSAATTQSLFTTFPAATAAHTVASFDWTPAAGSPARTGGLSTFTGTLATKAGAAVTATSFRGAVDPAGAKWWQGWTSYARN
ncbi:MAG TPA: fibronectin type III domain-containing protein [Longimicrobium sp.]|nr:fibronectin type III domain-containing protein [Longimicrobium sp.]